MNDGTALVIALGFLAYVWWANMAPARARPVVEYPGSRRGVLMVPTC